jgi:hypothetical protein
MRPTRAYICVSQPWIYNSRSRNERLKDINDYLFCIVSWYSIASNSFVFENSNNQKKYTVLHQIMLISIIDHCFCFENFSQSGKKTLKLNFTIYDFTTWFSHSENSRFFPGWLKFSKQNQWSIIDVSIIWCNTVRKLCFLVGCIFL